MDFLPKHFKKFLQKEMQKNSNAAGGNKELRGLSPREDILEMIERAAKALKKDELEKNPTEKDYPVVNEKTGKIKK
jgi:hypothetical protein